MTYTLRLNRPMLDRLIDTLRTDLGEGVHHTDLDAESIRHPAYALSYARGAQESILTLLNVDPAWHLPDAFKPSLRGS